MFITKKGNQYWLWSSKKASLGCMPWYKSESLKKIQVKYFKKTRELNQNYE